ncbi:Na+/H+ antiporter NhaC family protein [Brevibacillus dissolubilis]|uniref:Na+/H+ antiporter NhaC family protein n=1 Tax=Brevibacillus dissolubilis TaxID=1844116 RepID=UPI001115B47E|nr:Na+/H+ antiporter NhaC family protein [Brevibacillus dissolubilis]
MTLRGYVPITALMVGIAVCLLMGWQISIGLAFALIVTLITVSTMGIRVREQIEFGWQGVRQTKPVLLILFLVGLLIPLLMMGGTIPAIIYYGLSVVHVDYLMVIGFLLTSAVSYLLGTSVGTLSTIGLALMGIAHAAQVPLGMMAGALISGAMVGERFSPISSARLLVLSSLDGDERITRFSYPTGLVALGMCILMFFGLDLWMENATAGETIATNQQLLSQYFSISWIQLIPLMVLIGSFALRIKAIHALGLGVGMAGVMFFLTHQMEWGDFVHSMLYGYDLGSGTKLDELVHGGGMMSILKVLLLISLAGFMNGILDKANLLKPIVDRLLGQTKSNTSLVIKAVFLSLFVVIISCNQTIPILVIAATLRTRFEEWTGGQELLGRTMLDATLMMPVLVPWNGLAMVMSVTLGVPTLEILPYVWYPLLLPCLTVLFTLRSRGGKSTVPSSNPQHKQHAG